MSSTRYNASVSRTDRGRMGSKAKPEVVVATKSFSDNEVLLGELAALGVTVVPNTGGRISSEGELGAFIGSAQCAVVGLEPVGREVLEMCPNLRLVAKYGVGLDNLDQTALDESGVEIGWTAGVNRRSVSELTLAFALGHLRNVVPSMRRMGRGDWIKEGGRQLSDCVFGIVGLGNIGTDTARLVRAFGTKVLYCDIEDRSLVANALDLEARDFGDLLEDVDVLSFHVPSTNLTRKMFGRAEIARVRDTALVINTSRGSILPFEEVVSAVLEERLGGFATDVYPLEPFDGSRLASEDRIYLTPHIGGNSSESVLAMGRSAIGHVRAYLQRCEDISET